MFRIHYLEELITFNYLIFIYLDIVRSVLLRFSLTFKDLRCVVVLLCYLATHFLNSDLSLSYDSF